MHGQGYSYFLFYCELLAGSSFFLREFRNLFKEQNKHKKHDFVQTYW